MTECEAQGIRLLRYMEEGNAVTQKLAFIEFNCARLGARMWELREAGIPVQSDWEYEYDENGKVINKWKRYWSAKQ